MQESTRFNLLHRKRVTFWLDTVKRGVNFKISDTLFRVSFAVLCSCIGTQLTSKCPPGSVPADQQVSFPFIHVYILFLYTDVKKRFIENVA